MKYNPEDANANLIPTGTWCDSLIAESVESQSKAGNEMIVADFIIYDSPGVHPVIRHYFVASKPGQFKKLCAALDLDYASGNIPAASLRGKSIKVLIKIQADDTGQYQDKNVIAAFAKEIPAGVPPTIPLQFPNDVRGVDDVDDKDCPF